MAEVEGVSEEGELFERNVDQEMKDWGLLIFLHNFLDISNLDCWIRSMSSWYETKTFLSLC